MSDPSYAYPYPAQYANPKKLPSEKCVYLAEMSDPKYAEPYAAQYAYLNPAQGYYQGPPVMALPVAPPPVMAPPPQYAAPPPRREPGFLDACRAALCCWGIFDDCCYDPLITSFGY